MPFSTACNTPLSNFESGQNYKDVIDPAGEKYCKFYNKMFVIKYNLSGNEQHSIGWTYDHFEGLVQNYCNYLILYKELQ